MPFYKVACEVEVVADSPVAAAHAGYFAITTPQDKLPVLGVTDLDTRETVDVDLDAEDDPS